MTVTHGMSETKVYFVWWDMKRRCNGEGRPTYENYGGRGISYQESWDKFEEFWSDMGASFEEGLTLERKDVNGNYCKENCEWIPLAEQAKNKRAYKNNSIGLGGCCLFPSRGRLYLRARIQDSTTKKRVNKLYNLAKIDVSEALVLAEQWLKVTRLAMGYKEGHGSEG
jgi:hypothetical protein